METTQMKIPLHDYQIYAKDFVLQHPYCGLFLKMGLGKTSIVLEALWELNPTEHVLVIAPKTIARCTWVNEIDKWQMPFRTQSLVVNERGKQLTRKKRNEIYDSIPSAQPTVYFINREMLNDLYKRFPSTNKSNIWPFRTIIIDESQSFKSYDSVRFKTMKKIRRWVSRIVLLTGSPAPKSLEDLWAQIWILDMGQRLETTITKYRERYFNPGIIVNNYPVNWRPKWGAEEEIYDKISDIVISMKNKYIQLPPLTFNPVTVTMDEEAEARYQTLMKESVLEINGETIEAVNAAVLSAKLSQMASGAIYTNARTVTYETIHNSKAEMCEYIINNTPDNVIIAYHFKSDKQMILDHLTSVGITAVDFDGSPEMERAWNEKKIPVLLLQPASCGHGLNLQEGGHTLIWYTLPWSLEHYEQTNARIYRQGQKDPVIIHQLLTKGTIDTRILKALKLKDMSQERLIAAVEATVNNEPDETI